eukprot:2551353-Rhodomonas_salina.1
MHRLDQETAAFVGQVLKEEELWSLKLTNCDLRDEGFEQITQVRDPQAAPPTLSARDRWVLEQGLKDAGEAAALEELHAGMNGIGARGASALAGWARFSGTLAVLDLQLNALGDAGAQALAQALANNGCAALAALNVQGNGISHVGARALCEALQSRGGAAA